MTELRCRHLLACHTIWYDPTNPVTGYSLGRVIVYLRPSAGLYPSQVGRLFLYGQLTGGPGEHTVYVRLAAVNVADDGTLTETVVADYGPWTLEVSGFELAESFALPLLEVPIPAGGLYEFQLWADGYAEPLARERIEAQE